jgi:hypothetical protein
VVEAKARSCLLLYPYHLEQHLSKSWSLINMLQWVKRLNDVGLESQAGNWERTWIHTPDFTLCALFSIPDCLSAELGRKKLSIEYLPGISHLSPISHSDILLPTTSGSNKNFEGECSENTPNLWKQSTGELPQPPSHTHPPEQRKKNQLI